MEYVWKINMIDGKSYFVETNISNLQEFTEGILPRNEKETISFFKCVNEEIYDKCACKYNSVVIIGSKVASVEYFVR